MQIYMLLVALLGSGVLAMPTTDEHTITKRVGPNFSYLDCYSEPSGGRAIELKSTSSDAMTTEYCASFCSDYKYFGTEYSEQCFCGNQISSGSNPTTGCTMTCKGNSSEICGDGGKLSLYINKDYVAPSVATISGWAYQGCHTEGSGERLLQEKSSTDDNMTPQKCADACSGYRYAGIEYGRECWCGDTLHGGTYAADSDCSFLCPGDQHSFCGAGNRLTLYAVPGPANLTGYNYKGCYVDDVNTRLFNSIRSGDDNMTVEECAAACSQYSYFGVENGNECFCGLSLNSSISPVSESQCGKPCPGNRIESCGDANRLSVYQSSPLKTPPSNPPTVSKFSYKYCSHDDGDMRVLTGDRKGDNSMTVEMCAAFCTNYAYFGVEYAVECFCGNTFAGSAHNESDCSYVCPGNATEFCGAASRINVYQASNTTTLV
ncbi:copper radical oxidase [Seiridium cupressi]